MCLLKILKGKRASRFGMGGVEADEQFYHCLDCDFVWIGPCPSPCRKCQGLNVVRCSEEEYNQYREKDK